MSENVEQRLAEIRERNGARTAGKWAVSEANDVLWIVKAEWEGEGICAFRTFHPVDASCGGKPEATFIANASTDIPWLLALVDRLMGMIDDVQRSSEMARQWERAACVAVLDAYEGRIEGGEPEGIMRETVQYLRKEILKRGPTPQDAPDVSACREEIVRLRVGLRKIADERFWDRSDERNIDVLRDIARQALGEEKDS